MNNLGVYSCDDNGFCENTLDFNTGGGYAIPIGTPTDKPIIGPSGYVPSAPALTTTTIAILAVAVFVLFAMGGRR